MFGVAYPGQMYPAGYPLFEPAEAPAVHRLAPPERRATVPAENRRRAVPAEPRRLVVPAEARRKAVPAEERRVTVPAETRRRKVEGS